MLVIEILLYFVVGFILDVCYTIWYGGISDKKKAVAAAGSYLVTVVGYTLLQNLLLSASFMWHLQGFAIGCALGTAVAMWYKERWDVSNNNKKGT